MKQQLRLAYLSIRQEFLLTQGSLHYSTITFNLIALLKTLNRYSNHAPSIIGSYIPVPTKQIIPPHLHNHPSAFPRFQPKTKGKPTPIMEFKLHSPSDSYTERTYSIKIPQKNKPTIFPQIVLVPLVCFHPTSKHRIGYGGGYYDAYISASRSNQHGTIFIGVAFECMQTEQEFWEKRDQALNYVVTEKRVY